MSRIPLAAGTKIELCNAASKREVIIDRLIGQGANCLAYDAHCVNERGIQIAVRLKECYPMDADTERQGQTLCWRSEAECRGALERFSSACDILQQLKNDSSIGTHVSSGELFQGNGTLYTWMENNYAATFAHFQPKTLTELLEAILLLTKIVSRIHRSGYLHLDIKPENFLYTNDPAPFISLIDVDTLTSIQAIKAGHVPAVPYSQSYAAPEQLAGKLSRIDQRTDLFAIGAILFEQLFHRKVGNDDIGAFAEWDFVLPLFEDVDPKAARLIRTVLKKTIAAAVKRRYESAEGLINDLEQAIEASRWHPFLISNVPYNAYFQGRVEELKMVAAAFDAGKHMVFLHGVGGIGKTTLAKAYAEKYAARYDTVLFKRYRADHQSMQAVLDEIEIQNFHGDSAEHMRQLRRLLDKHALLIIDNYDVALDETEGLEALFSLRADILVTTRTDFSEILQQNAMIIDVDQLPEEELLNLFFHFGHITPQSSSAADAKEIIERVAGHTMAVELVARQIAASGMTLAEMKTALNEQGLLTMKDSVKVRAIKDEVILKTTLPDIIRKLFSMATLNDTQQEVMRSLALLSHVFVTRKLYRKIFRDKPEYSDALNELLELGFLKHDDDMYEDTEQETISMHPLINEIILKDLRPNVNDCKHLTGYLTTIINDTFMPDYYGNDPSEEKKDIVTRLMIGVCDHLDISLTENMSFIVQWLAEYDSIVDPREFCYKVNMPRLDTVDLRLRSGSGWDIPSYTDPRINSFYRKLEQYLKKTDQPEWIALILLCASLNDLSSWREHISETVDNQDVERGNVLKYYHLAVDIMKTLPEEKKYIFIYSDAKGNKQYKEEIWNIKQRYKKLLYINIAAALDRCYYSDDDVSYSSDELAFYSRLAQDTYACCPNFLNYDGRMLKSGSVNQRNIVDYILKPDEQDKRIDSTLTSLALRLEKESINTILVDFLNDTSIQLADKLRILDDGGFQILRNGYYYHRYFAEIITTLPEWAVLYEVYDRIIKWLHNIIENNKLENEYNYLGEDLLYVAESALESHEYCIPLILYHTDKLVFEKKMNDIIDYYAKTIVGFFEKSKSNKAPLKNIRYVHHFRFFREVEFILYSNGLSHVMVPYMQEFISMFERLNKEYQDTDKDCAESIKNYLMELYDAMIGLATDAKEKDPSCAIIYELMIYTYTRKLNDILNIDFELR